MPYWRIYADVGRLTDGMKDGDTMATKYDSLNAAMLAGDELAEAEMRYRLLSVTFEENPKLQAQLNPSIERAKAEIMRLRAQKPKADSTAGKSDGKVVAFDAARFRKSG